MKDPKQETIHQHSVAVKLPTLEVRMLKLLELIADEKRRCNACGVPLYFVRHQNGQRAPYTAEGLNHFIDCPKANLFRDLGRKS